jgi:hypothetical protein
MDRTTCGQYALRLSQSTCAYVALHTRLVHNLVDVVRSDTRFRRTRRDVQYFSPQPTHLAHAFYLLLVQDRNFVPVDKDLL